MFMLHRQENIMNRKFIVKVVKQIVQLAKEMHCVFIFHEQTKAKMLQFGVFDLLATHQNITILPASELL